MSPEIAESVFRDELRERRRRLEAALAAGGEGPRLARLLDEVDSALARLDSGRFGVCETCHESIGAEDLLGHPLLRTCIDHLTPRERQALEDDLALASRIQSGLLPHPRVSLQGWQACYRYEPAGAVGGDYCDLLTRGPEAPELYFLLGDVAGKGMSASIRMAALRAIVRTLLESDSSVSGLVERANRLFCETALPENYATLVCGRAGAEGEVEICNAGHCRPLLARGVEVTEIETTGTPVGLVGSTRYETRRLRLEPGDTLLLYTDGISEARNREGEEYGAARLAAALRRHHGAPPEDLVRACLEDLTAFRAGSPRTDDLTLLAVLRSPASR